MGYLRIRRLLGHMVAYVTCCVCAVLVASCSDGTTASTVQTLTAKWGATLQIAGVEVTVDQPSLVGTSTDSESARSVVRAQVLVRKVDGEPMNYQRSDFVLIGADGRRLVTRGSSARQPMSVGSQVSEEIDWELAGDVSAVAVEYRPNWLPSKLARWE